MAESLHTCATSAGEISIIPGVVSHGAVDECPPVEPTPMPTPMPTPISDSDCQRQSSQWLDHRIQQDRLGLCQYIEEQHRKLLSDFRERISGTDIDAKPASSMPRLGKGVSFACSAGGSQTSLTEHVIQSTAGQVKKESMQRGSSPGPRLMGAAHNGNGLERDDYDQIDIEQQLKSTSSTGRFSELCRSLTSGIAQPLEDATNWLNKVEVFVEGQKFELACIAAIFLNAISIAVEQQYNGEKLGCSLNFPSYEESGKWGPWVPTMFAALDKAFVAIFVVELVLRLVATRQRWFRSLWNYTDLLLICIAVVSWLEPVFGTTNPTFVRMVRFGKLARIMRVMRSNRLVESLKLITASVQASFNTLCVSLFVLLLIQSVAAMFLSQLVDPFLKAETDPSDLHQQDVKNQVFAYYGTFWRSMITMFEITFANWAPTCRLLVDNVNEWFGLFFLLHRCIVGFAMLSVIQAVFIQQTMKSAQLDEDYMVQQKQREKDSYVAKLKALFKRLDTSGDGQLNWDEFHSLVSDTHMKFLMSALDVDVRDLESLFFLLEDGGGSINADEFVDGLQRIKGPAQSLDMVNLLRIVERIEAKIAKMKMMKTRSFLK
jgi:hypothetical protein